MFSIHLFPYLAVVTSQSRWVDYGGPRCGENHIKKYEIFYCKLLIIVHENFVAFSKHFVGKNKTLLYKNPSELSGCLVSLFSENKHPKDKFLVVTITGTNKLFVEGLTFSLRIMKNPPTKRGLTLFSAGF